MQRDFIANVSHDFKTPLSVIRNYSEAIYDDIIEEKSKKEYLKEIIREVDRLNILVMDILELSKFQGKNQILNKEYFNLNEFLLDFKRTFKIPLQIKNVKLNITVMDSNFYILADSVYLHRVIYNFIDNAIKFSKSEGVIQLEAIKIKEGIKVLVRDHGVGIESKYMDDIWQRYYKTNNSGGMGLGLAISSEILKLHNFRYGVFSDLGKNTEFYFIISLDSIVKK
jgi:signal transduction histidine kinase